MRAPGPRLDNEPADLIARHPAMQRILNTQRAWIDGGRVLGYRTAVELDLIKHHPDPLRRVEAQRWCSLVTPVIKAAFTHQAFHGASGCLQVFGGHGYVREWGIEQIVRDARVSMIYEGTNEIQAIDLLVRKVVPDGAQALGDLLQSLATELGPQARETCERLVTLQALATDVAQAAAHNAELPLRVADDFLRATALALLDWAWQRIAAAPQADPGRWQAPAAALADWVLPEFDMRVQIMRRALAA